MLKPEFRHYRTWLFDCDGVLLDSNRLKTEAFGRVAQRYSDAAAQALVDHHRRNGGISRFEKFRWLFAEVLRREPQDGEIERCVDAYAEQVHGALLTCPASERLVELLDALGRDTRRFVVTGGAQAEVQAVFAARGLDAHFDAIHGSPRDKMEIVTTLVARGEVPTPAVLLGDSRYDHEVAAAHGFDFIFVADWSEWQDAAATLGPDVRRIGRLQALLEDPA